METKSLKSVIMDIKEFLNFRKLAFQKKKQFNCERKGLMYEVQADKEWMELIGY